MAPSVDGSGVRGYPRPQLRRAGWESLNGRWEFAIDARAQVDRPNEVRWERDHRGAVQPETPASGVAESGFYERCWYRRRFQVAPLGVGERILVHFGAVDSEAVVYVDGRFVGRHEGGYTPFSVDLTLEVADGGEHELVVRADDDPRTSPSRAASKTGRGAALHLVPQDDRDLANGLARAAATNGDLGAALDPQSRPLGDRPPRADRGNEPDAHTLEVVLRPGPAARATTATGWWRER
jgi:hypothetical protein